MMSDTRVNGPDPVAMNGKHKKKRKKKQTFTPLELDMTKEADSLIHETGDFSHVVSTLTLRRKRPSGIFSSLSSSSGESHVLGLLRSNLKSVSTSFRNFLFFALLGGMVLLFLGTMDQTVNVLDHNKTAKSESKTPGGPHESSFGGKLNVAHHGGAVAHSQHDVHHLHDVTLPEPKVPWAVPSVSEENIVNHVGQYWHDPYKDPFASFLYQDLEEGTQDAKQEAFVEKMQTIQQEWGKWSLRDDYKEKKGKARPQADFEKYNYRDVPNDEFPTDAWQTDQDYVSKFLQESKLLLQRVKNAIYTEYGHGLMNSTTTEERDELFRVIVDNNLVIQNGIAMDGAKQDFTPKLGIAYMNSNTWDGLVTKLLHSILTQDYFFVVLAGSSGNHVGLGNNFVQSQMMQFHYLMEPIFDQLDMKLVSRNMAIPDASTVTSAMAGADVYGEADILIMKEPPPITAKGKNQHVDTPAMTKGPADFFNKQAILAGERVPVLLTRQHDKVLRDSQGRAWVGNLQEGAAMCPEMKDSAGTNMPRVCHGLNCSLKKSSYCKPKYNSVCWVDRTDYLPDTAQLEQVPNDNSKYPGYTQHLLEGRKLSLLVLHALEAALDLWLEGIETDGFPLKESYWHVGDMYRTIQEAVKTRTTPDNDNSSNNVGCEEFLHAFPMLCRTPMHGFTEWTPRVTPAESSLRHIVDPSVTLWSRENENFAYGSAALDVDLLAPQWELASDEIDVHAIAIATGAPPPETNEWDEYEDDEYPFLGGDDDFAYVYEDDFVNNNGGDRWLRTLEEEGKGSVDIEPRHSSVRQGQERDQRQTKVVEKKPPKETKSSGGVVADGDGWILYNIPPGFCDGSAQSTLCKKSSSNNCLMAGHNDANTAGLMGTEKSGWLILNIPNMQHGILLARFETDIPMKKVPKLTNGQWTETVGKPQHGHEDDQRQLYISSDFEIDYALNGEISTLSGHEFINMGVNVVDGLTVWPFMLGNPSPGKTTSSLHGETLEFAIRIRTDSQLGANILLSHVYYA